MPRPSYRRRTTASPFLHGVNRLLLLLIAAVLAATLYFVFQPELQKLHDLERKEQALLEEHRRAQIEQLRLERDKTLLDSDPLYLENIAREKLDLMKPGETIFRLEPRSSPAPSSPPQ